MLNPTGLLFYALNLDSFKPMVMEGYDTFLSV